MPVLAIFKQCWRDDRGAAIIEFAFVAPVLILGLLGLFDLSYNIYIASLLEGSIQKAARDSTIEGSSSSQGAIDARVTSVISKITPNATVTFDRKSYENFADISRPEDFNDLDGDGVCNNGEPYDDVNGNNMWDTDRGSDGGGSARDAVLYTVTITYPRAFPMHGLMGLDPEVSTTTRTVLRNQPYGQQEIDPSVGNCA